MKTDKSFDPNEIENLKQLYWKFEHFINRLNLSNEKDINSLCCDFENDLEVYDISHRAKQENEQLVKNNKDQLINKFRYKFKELFETKKDIENRLKDRNNLNYITMALRPVVEFYKELTNTEKNQQLTELKGKRELLGEKLAAYLSVIDYFDEVNLNPNGNQYLKDLYKKDKIHRNENPEASRPFNLEDEFMFNIKEAEIKDLEDLFIKKFNEEKEKQGYKTTKKFAKDEFNYLNGIWANHDIKNRIPISGQWLEFLEKKSLAQNETAKNQSNKETDEHPFTDEKTKKLFEHIVKYWDYDKDQKWADIWNAINESESYKAPYQNEYREYVIKRFGYTGKFQYDKVKRDENRDQKKLLEKIEEFSKK